MHSDNKLLLFRFALNLKSLLLKLVDDGAKIVRDLPACFCDFYQDHAPV